MPVLRLFAQAREAAGAARDVVEGDTVDQVLAAAESRYGEVFAALLPSCRVWVNGEPAHGSDPVAHGDEVAILPPVSGGADGTPAPARTGPPGGAP
jgi:molybdopterin converting factor small subunit